MELPLQNREIILEYISVGQFVKVVAMDAKTLIEISIQGPATTPETILKRNALKRLEYVLKKKDIID